MIWHGGQNMSVLAGGTPASTLVPAQIVSLLAGSLSRPPAQIGICAGGCLKEPPGQTDPVLAGGLTNRQHKDFSFAIILFSVNLNLNLFLIN